MSSTTRTIYIGVTNDLERRVLEHKSKEIPGFTKKYASTKLVYYEESNSVYDAIEREKQIKAWRRSKKVELVNSVNPKWLDLAADLVK
jgi:putative endonuclease